MKRGHEDSGHSSGSAWRRRDTGLKMKYCLKALIPDVLASYLLRDKGTLKDELQQESGSRFVFSNKGDFFPDTQLRVLGVYSDLPDGVTRALDLIVGKMTELSEDERSRQAPAGCEMVGKEGELILRVVLSREMTGLLIGSQGAKIKELRRDSGCKINIRDEAVAGHRLATFAGTAENLIQALHQVAENMKTEAETESGEFQHYLRVINFGEEEGGMVVDGAMKQLETMGAIVVEAAKVVDITATQALAARLVVDSRSWVRNWMRCLLELPSFHIPLVVHYLLNWFLLLLDDLVTSSGPLKAKLAPKWTLRVKELMAIGRWSALDPLRVSMQHTV